MIDQGILNYEALNIATANASVLLKMRVRGKKFEIILQTF